MKRVTPKVTKTISHAGKTTNVTVKISAGSKTATASVTNRSK